MSALEFSTRRWKALVTGAVCAIAVSGCADTGGGDTAAGTELKCAVSSTRESGDYAAAEAFAEALAEKTDNTLSVRIYPDSQLGDYESVIQQIKAGTIDCLYESIGTLATESEVAGIEATPYLYRSTDQFFEVWNGDIGADLIEQVEQDTGIRLIGPAFRGFRQVAAQSPINTIEDLGGLKLRVPAIPAYVDAWTALGASPTPLPFSETYSALQQGVVTGVENSLIGISSQKFFEVAPDISITDHMAETMGFMFNADRVDQLDESVQTAIDEAAADSAQFYRSYTEENEDQIIEDLTAAGATFTRPDLAPFAARVADFDPGDALRPYVEAIRALS